MNDNKNAVAKRAKRFRGSSDAIDPCASADAAGR